MPISWEEKVADAAKLIRAILLQHQAEAAEAEADAVLERAETAAKAATAARLSASEITQHARRSVEGATMSREEMTRAIAAARNELGYHGPLTYKFGGHAIDPEK